MAWEKCNYYQKLLLLLNAGVDIGKKRFYYEGFAFYYATQGVQ